MHERLVERFVRVLEVHVLADDADLDRAARRVLEAADDALPSREVRRAAPDVEPLGDELVEPLVVEHERHLVDAPDVDRADDRFDGHVREERDLLFDGARERHLRAAEEDVRLDANLAHLLDRVLRRLGLQLAGGRDVRHERDVDAERVLRARFDLHLADGLEERERLDVARRAADLDDGDVDPLGRVAHARLDLVGDVRDDLHRRAQVLAAPLLRDDALVDAAGREVVLPRHARGREALVVSEVEVGLGAVVGDEDLAVLVRAHRSGVDVDVRIELDVRDPQPARLEQRADRGAGEPLADRGDDPAGDEHVLRRFAAHRGSPPDEISGGD